MKKPKLVPRQEPKSGAYLLMIGTAFIMLLVAAMTTLTGCAQQSLKVPSAADVTQAIDSAQGAVQTAKDLTTQAQAVADKANQVIELGKQIEGVVTK
jgi:outer membrane lipoprotein-sorting protein